MPKIKLLEGTGIGRAYNSATIDEFVAGTIRDVSTGEVDYLLATFPGCFVRPGPAPTQRPRGPAVSMGPILAAGVRVIRAEIEAGVHDGYLPELRTSEVAGKNRTGALAAIDARRATLAGG